MAKKSNIVSKAIASAPANVESVAKLSAHKRRQAITVAIEAAPGSTAERIAELTGFDVATVRAHVHWYSNPDRRGGAAFETDKAGRIAVVGKLPRTNSSPVSLEAMQKLVKPVAAKRSRKPAKQ